MPNVYGRPTLGEILAAGVSHSIQSLQFIGRSVGEIVSHVQRRFRDPTERSILAAINRTNKAMLAADALNSMLAGQAVLRSAVPLSPLLQSQVPGAPQPYYQFTNSVEWIDADSGDANWVNIIVDSPRNLTRGELEAEVLAVWEQIHTGQRGSPRSRGHVPESPTAILTTQIWRTH